MQISELVFCRAIAYHTLMHFLRQPRPRLYHSLMHAAKNDKCVPRTGDLCARSRQWKLRRAYICAAKQGQERAFSHLKPRLRGKILMKGMR